MKRLGLAFAFWAAFSFAAFAQVGGLSFPGPGPRVASGGSPSFTFQAGINSSSLSGGNLIATFSGNFSATQGTGSKFVIVGEEISNNNGTITQVAVNGTPLTFIKSDQGASLTGSTLAIFAGVANITGTDSVTITNSASMATDGTMAAVWTASNLTSTTAISSNGNVSTSISLSGLTAGNFGFAVGSQLWTGPTGITSHALLVSPVDGSQMGAADIIFSSGNLTAGTANLTPASNSFNAVGAWD